MRDKFFVDQERSQEQTLARCVDHVELSCQMCHVPARFHRMSSFPFRCAVVSVLHAPFASLFPRSFLEVSRRHVGGNRVSCWWVLFSNSFICPV